MQYEMKLQKKYKRIVQSGAMNVFKWILVATDVIGVIRGGHLAPAPDSKRLPREIESLYKRLEGGLQVTVSHRQSDQRTRWPTFLLQP